MSSSSGNNRDVGSKGEEGELGGRLERWSMKSNMEPPPRRPLYEESSQFKRWRFAPSKLVQLRAVLNERSIQIVRENLQAEKQASSSSSTTLDPPTPLDIQYLTPDDEVLLVSFYVSSIPRTCAGFGLPEVVEATAISYLKRFYLWNTCMDYHPRKVMFVLPFLVFPHSSQRRPFY